MDENAENMTDIFKLEQIWQKQDEKDEDRWSQRIFICTVSL